MNTVNEDLRVMAEGDVVKVHGDRPFAQPEKAANIDDHMLDLTIIGHDNVRDFGDMLVCVVIECHALKILGWVERFNNRRLLGPIGRIPPAEAEANVYAQRDVLDRVA